MRKELLVCMMFGFLGSLCVYAHHDDCDGHEEVRVERASRKKKKKKKLTLLLRSCEQIVIKVVESKLSKLLEKLPHYVEKLGLELRAAPVDYTGMDEFIESSRELALYAASKGVRASYPRITDLHACSLLSNRRVLLEKYLREEPDVFALEYYNLLVGCLADETEARDALMHDTSPEDVP